jgi:hypothetical protein
MNLNMVSDSCRMRSLEPIDFRIDDAYLADET